MNDVKSERKKKSDMFDLVEISALEMRNFGISDLKKNANVLWNNAENKEIAK